MLKQWAVEGLVRVLYLDESGFEKTSPLTYSDVKRGQQHRMVKPQRRGRRISVLGVWQPGRQFDYGMVVGGFNSDRYLTLMHWQAERAKAHWQATGQITVIIQDGASFHRSKAVQAWWQRWQEMGLFIFFLPPYSPQMNRIEDEWLHLKRHELGSQLFEQEYDLAITLINLIEQRGQRRGYAVERFIFNSG
ncbi:MAG: transposase [Leptolyngbyaceae cyanobacterium HOT.MB2.61]|nr:transposase [Leptolyngbyaceae cyanobacterium HOT.MB2.61]